MSKEWWKGSTPTMIMTLLARSDLYGYELLKQLELHSGGVFTLKEGTLYPILHQLEADGWIASYWEEVNGRRRKYYRLTEAGGSALREKKEEWATFRNAMDLMLKERPL